MAKKKLHEAYWRPGPIGNTVCGCTLTVGPKRITVTVRNLGEAPRAYLLDEVYSSLIKQAYALGLAQKPLVP